MEHPIKSRGMQLVEARYGRPLDLMLRELYEEQGKTLRQVGLELGVSTASVSRWMAELGIEARYLGRRRAVA